MKRIIIIEADTVLFNMKISNVEELLRVSRESRYRRLRHLKRAAIFARTSAARKAAECAKPIHSKTTTSLQVARKIFREDVYRLHREHDDDCQQAMIDETRRLEGPIASCVAAIKEKHHSNIDYARQQRDAKVSILKGQHETEINKLRSTLAYMCSKMIMFACVHAHVCVGGGMCACVRVCVCMRVILCKCACAFFPCIHVLALFAGATFLKIPEILDHISFYSPSLIVAE